MAVPFVVLVATRYATDGRAPSLYVRETDAGVTLASGASCRIGLPGGGLRCAKRLAAIARV